MSKKFIATINQKDFVYPNNTIQDYGTEIVHDINNNSVSGTVTNFTGTSISSSGITISFNYTWALNGAEPFVDENGNYSFLSLHAMEPSKPYYKPWRMIYPVTGTTASTKTGSVSTTITPSQFGINSFTNGTYQFEIRMIGKRAIYPICQSLTVSSIIVPTPTPTPTATTGPTPTPTPTPTATPVGGTYQSGATLNVTDAGWIKYTSYTGGTGVYLFIATTGTYTLTDCAICDTIIPGFPFADIANFTITNCGTSCGGAPIPTATPAPTATAGSFGYYSMVDCQTYETKYSQLLSYGTYNSGDRVEGSYGYFYVISGFTPSYQPITYTITGTGQYGCP